MDQNSTVYQRIVCIMDQNSTVYERIFMYYGIRILQYINYYRRWPLYLGLSVFWCLDPGTICRFPGTICKVPGTI